ncbi:MAG: AraC family transcriptional regulator [Myxococcota bacterium]
MDLATYTPGPPLDAHIEQLIHYRAYRPVHAIERVVPNGRCFLVMELDGMERRTYHNATLEIESTFRGAWICGMLRGYISISAHQDSEMFVVQFRPGGARPFLRVSMDSIADRVVPAQDIWGDEPSLLRTRLLEAGTREEKFEVAETWLRQHFREELQPPLQILKVLEGLSRTPGERLAEVIEAYPNSRKHLISEFRRYVGITPKYFQRILRFSEVFRQLENHVEVRWSAVAHHCGYADQAHFIRDFRHFSGFNPTALLGTGSAPERTNFFPIG